MPTAFNPEFAWQHLRGKEDLMDGAREQATALGMQIPLSMTGATG